MNSVLMSGLAVGKDVGVCAACDFDYEWVIAYPTTLVWSERIILTPTMWEKLTSGRWPDDWLELAEVVKLVFEIAEEAGIVEVRDPREVITPKIVNAIYGQAKADQSAILQSFPDMVSLTDRGLIIDGIDYCVPYVSSLYSILFLAAVWNTQCFLDDRALNYWKYRFGSVPCDLVHTTRADAFHTVFSAYLPEESLASSYLTCSAAHRDKLDTCDHRTKCQIDSLQKVEKKVKNLIRWRDYDEVHQLRAVVEKIVQEREAAGGALNPTEVAKDLKDRERDLNRRVRLVFPRTERWADMATMISVPVSLAGAGTGSPALIYSGASIAAVAQFAKLAVGVLKSRYSWIGFNPRDSQGT